MSIRVFKLDKDVFMDGGVLVFGQWQPSRNRRSKPPTSSFEGEIDEVRFWERQTNPDLIRRNWRLNVQIRQYPGLLCLWKFNQAEGYVIPDLVSDNHLYIIKFHEPLWAFSDADIPIQSSDITFQELSLQLKAEKYCRSLLLKGTLFSRCEKLGIQVAQFYYSICLNDVAVSRELNWAIYSVVSYADYCQTELTLAVWPAKDLCHHFFDMNFPNWIGGRCEIRCVFGYAIPKANTSGEVTCSCEHGYWGNDCSNLCPGGLWNICSGHGVCSLVNGTCFCEPHWRGSAQFNNSEYSNCSQCTTGWTGSDCSIAVEKSVREANKTGLSINFGDPHFTTVTGANYHFEAPGSYQLLKLQGIDVQILQIPCDNRLSCRRITEIAVNTTTNFLSLMYEESGTVSSFLLDYTKGENTSLQKSDSWNEVGGFTFRWIHTKILEVKEKVMNVKFTILLYNGAVGAAIEVPIKVRDDTFGICGKEESDWVKDLQSRLNNNTNSTNFNQAILEERIIAQETISKENVILKNRFSGFTFTGAGFMLIFGSHKQVVLVGDSSYDPLNEFTFELWICLVNEASNIVQKCCSTHEQKNIKSTGEYSVHSLKSKHAIVSSSSKSGGFALLYDDGITVNFFGHEVKLGLNITGGIWHHVAVTWRNTDGRVQVFVNSRENATVSQSAYGLGMGELFSFDGFLLFGRYMKGSDIETEYDMTGALDEFRLWQYAKSGDEVSILKNVKFDHYVEGLVLNLPMDEGQGATLSALYYDPLSVTSLENVSSNHTTAIQKFVSFISLPPLDSLDWAPSGAPLRPSSNYTLAFRNATLKEKALTLCHEKFYKGSLQKYCSPRLVPQSLFYYESCLADIADSGDLAHHKLSVSLFGFYCQKVLGIKECLLYGTYDAFPKCNDANPNKELTPTEIVVIVTSSLMFVLFTCCLLWVLFAIIRKRNKKKNRIQQLTDTDAPESCRKYELTKDGSSAQPPETVEMVSAKRLLAPYETDSEDEKTPEDFRKYLLMENVRDPTGGVDNLVLDRGSGQEEETDF